VDRDHLFIEPETSASLSAIDDLPSDGPLLSETELQQRIDAALRAGNQRWLWPDVTVAKWQEALQSIERVTRAILCEGRSAEPVTGELDALRIAAYTSGMGPLLGHWIREGSVTASTEIAPLLVLHLQHNARRMERMDAAARQVMASLQAAGIDALLLKGMHTSGTYFPSRATRTLSDIDIFVPPRHEPRAQTILTDLGYERGEIAQRNIPRAESWHPSGMRTLPRSLNHVHCDDPYSIDLQFSLNRRTPGGSKVIAFDDLIASGEIAPGVSPLLPQPALLLHLACHAGINLASLSLMRQTELVFVIRKDFADGGGDWHRLTAMAEHLGVKEPVFRAFAIVNKLAPDTVPDDVMREFAAPTSARLRAQVANLQPANAHRLTGKSADEFFVWNGSIGEAVMEVLRTVLPIGSVALRRLPQIYLARFWRAVRSMSDK